VCQGLPGCSVLMKKHENIKKNMLFASVADNQRTVSPSFQAGNQGNPFFLRPY
jgi:hypothetical protein